MLVEAACAACRQRIDIPPSGESSQETIDNNALFSAYAQNEFTVRFGIVSHQLPLQHGEGIDRAGVVLEKLLAAPSLGLPDTDSAGRPQRKDRERERERLVD